MEKPEISEAHNIFRKFVGTWQGEQAYLPTKWNPEGALATDRIKNQLALDGFLLIQDLAQSRDGKVVYRAHNLFRWDENEASYILYWFDSIGFPPSELRGELSGDVLTFTGIDPGGHSRLTYDFSQPDLYAFEQHFSEDGTNWQVHSKALFHRV